MARTQISPLQFIALFITSFVAVPISILPSAIMTTAGTDSPASLLIGLFGAFILMTLIQLCSERLRRKRGHRRGIGYLTFTSLYIFFLLLVMMLTTRNFVEVVHTYFLLRTPKLVIGLCLLLVAVYGAWYGIVSIARLAHVSFFLTSLAIISMPLASIPNFRPELLFPLLAEPPEAILSAVVQTIAFCLESFFLLTILPLAASTPKQRFKLFSIAYLIGAMIVLIMFGLDFLTFGPYVGGYMVFTSVEFVRFIGLGEFMERMEIILILVWTIIMTLKVSLAMWIQLVETALLFRLTDYRVPAVPVLLISLFGFMLFPQGVVGFYYLTAYWWVIPVVFGAISFILLHLFAYTRKKTKKRASPA